MGERARREDMAEAVDEQQESQGTPRSWLHVYRQQKTGPTYYSEVPCPIWTAFWTSSGSDPL